MEWDEARDWDAQEGTLCSLVGKFKGDTAPRDFKLLVVVLRSRASLEDEQSLLERYQRTSKRAGLDNSRSIFVLNTSELKPQLRRLEALLWELAADFYKSEGKRIKNLKHKVNKSSQPRLYVRHHFKVAYYAEVCRDYPSALK